jgi:E1A/CREB-binding protein
MEGVYVAFFGLHLHEYGSNCPEPNRHRVYISYLDSVNLFQPKQYVTDAAPLRIFCFAERV